MGFVSLAVYRDRAHKRTLTMGGLGFLVFGFWFLVFGFWFLVFGFWFLVFGFWFLVFTFRDQNSITCYIGRYRPPYCSISTTISLLITISTCVATTLLSTPVLSHCRVWIPGAADATHGVPSRVCGLGLSMPLGLLLDSHAL
jgi:hypothetical protein